MSRTQANPAGIIPEPLLHPSNAPLLAGILRGVEKESLRVTPEGRLAQSAHPAALGSALTHSLITTDFSEALLEFITPPSHQVADISKQLRSIHRYTYANIGTELLWSNSMPCMVGDPAHIPVARYGTTNRGQMKTIYRIGLGHRYGRVMQTVAGVHYNFSLPSAFWAMLHQHERATESLEDFTTRRYFDLIRNFRRYYWLLIYLFGASPAICRSFVKGREHPLKPLDADTHTLHLPYATSLRMGDLGYQSKAQESLYVCYNSLASYVETLGAAIHTPYEPYTQIGLQDAEGQYQQLNTGLLQIENEFYSAIRPKRTARAGETALTALCRRGVEYIEVRCLDINPFSPVGLEETQMRFLDTFLLYCLFIESPTCDPAEFQRILLNQRSVVTEGRKPNLPLQDPAGRTISLQTWAEELLTALQPIADLLDQTSAPSCRDYRQAFQLQQQKVAQVTATPSARVLQELKDQQISFAQWTLRYARQYRQLALDCPLSAAETEHMRALAEKSLQAQAKEEAQPQAPFAEYLAAYYAQYQTCQHALSV